MTAPVWSELVGQEPVVATLSAAVAGDGMTHAWLFTGPPGSGRSVAARLFAQALQCPQGGCGACPSCVTAQAGTHPDITVVSTEGLSITVDDAREYVRKAALRPAQGRWQVIVVEDADRLTDQAANALLKALEEPAPRTVWMLCAPAYEDVMATIRSRCRSAMLRTPPVHAVARLLVERDGATRELAQAAASASQGHVGRARALAIQHDVRERRREVLAIPTRLHDLGSCLAAAAAIEAAAKAQAAERADDADAKELAALKEGWGVEDRGRRPAGYAGALSTLEREQKRRRTRIQRDSIDGVLLELLSFQRDVLARQLAPGAALVNHDVSSDVDTVARAGRPEATMLRIDAIVACREAIAENNAQPLLSLERLMIDLARPGR